VKRSGKPDSRVHGRNTPNEATASPRCRTELRRISTVSCVMVPATWFVSFGKQIRALARAGFAGRALVADGPRPGGTYRRAK